jgi:Tol biopolymer transport system component
MIIRTTFSLLLLFALSVAIAQPSLTLKKLTNVIDSYPAFSPDGKQIAFESNRSGNFDIYTMNIDATSLKRLTFDTSFDGTPAWSPDGKSITFASERDNDPEIYIMNADGSDQKRLTNAKGDDSHPKFSPDGKRIIFCSARSTPDLTVDWSHQWIEIFSMNINGNDIHQISHFKTVSTFPSYSPDGTKIVFRMVIDENGFNWDLTNTKRNSEIFVMNSDGSNPMNISNNAGFDGWPVWASDSKKILFASNRNGPANTSEIFMIDEDGKNLLQLTNGPEGFTQPVMSPDGRTIAAYNFRETKDYEFGFISLMTAMGDIRND